MSKATIRREVRRRLRQIDDAEQMNAGILIGDHMMQHIANSPLRILAAYSPIQEEVDPQVIIDHCDRQGWQIAWPRFRV